MFRTIRFKLAAAFAVAVLAAVTIGVVAVLVVRSTGDLVIRMYDQPLQAINYARLAQTNFVMLDLMVDRALKSTHGLPENFREDVQINAEDFLASLAVAEERGLNPEIRTYTARIREQNAAWLAAVRQLMDMPGSSPDHALAMVGMEKLGAGIITNLEIVTQMAAEDGYRFRLSAEETIRKAADQTTLLIAALFTLVVGITIALIRNIVTPLNRLTRTTIQLAGGNMDVAVPHTSRRDEIGSVAGALGVFKGAMEVVREAQEKAEAATRAKSEFLAMMSHEIRTPMNGVLGLTRLLLRSGLNDEQARLATTVLQSGQSLLRILNDILDFSKLEAGKADIEILDFELVSLMAGTTMLMRNRAEEKDLWLREEVDAALPAYLKGDPNRLRQIMLNLVGNAIKFTESGGVTLRAAPCADGARLRVEVADTGIGISEAARAKLFGSFVQADSSITRRFGGTGLGLAICKKLVEAMGGTIGVDSAQGAGSTFWFEIPLVEGSAVTADATGDYAAHAVRPLRILVADDNAINRKVLAGALAEHGHRVLFAEDGEMAVAMVRDADPPLDLVLMDVHMPRMDGMTATRAIRALSGPAAGVLIVAATASVGGNGVQRCLDAGMNAYVSKPIDPANLFKVIHRLVPDGAGQTASSDDEMMEAGATAGALLTGTEPFVPDMLAEMADSMGPDMALDLIDTFLSILPEVEPELFPADRTPEPQPVGEVAHSLKSAAGSLGLAQVYRTAAAVEAAGHQGDSAALTPLLSQLRLDLDEGVVWLRERRAMFDAAMTEVEP
ncbi:MAG: ATP-binding protein [Niveispirillum sp.]|uniref:ATP-binding protein n=1 Tax=Niveispirillum sp. TaxID=1917217 RepID=UPI003BA5D188